LTQLEMEILSQEMERSEREEGEGEGDGWLDYDSLNDFHLSGSAAYRDFRAMVLEDYRKRGKTRRAKATDSPPSATTTTTLQARQSHLGGDSDGRSDSSKKPTQLLTPEQAELFRHQNSQIPIRPYTLFTTTDRA